MLSDLFQPIVLQNERNDIPHSIIFFARYAYLLAVRLSESICNLLVHSYHYYQCVLLSILRDVYPYLKRNFQMMRSIFRRPLSLFPHNFYNSCKLGYYTSPAWRSKLYIPAFHPFHASKTFLFGIHCGGIRRILLTAPNNFSPRKLCFRNRINISKLPHVTYLLFPMLPIFQIFFRLNPLILRPCLPSLERRIQWEY